MGDDFCACGSAPVHTTLLTCPQQGGELVGVRTCRREREWSSQLRKGIRQTSTWQFDRKGKSPRSPDRSSASRTRTSTTSWLPNPQARTQKRHLRPHETPSPVLGTGINRDRLQRALRGLRPEHPCRKKSPARLCHAGLNVPHVLLARTQLAPCKFGISCNLAATKCLDHHAPKQRIRKTGTMNDTVLLGQSSLMGRILAAFIRGSGSSRTVMAD